MASYKNPQLRDKLASEYVLGTLRGQARARFQSLLKYDATLRQLVAEWEQKLTPLAAAAGDIEPHARVWRKIAARISGSAKAGWWANLALWRGLTVATTALTLALGVFIGSRPAPEPPMGMVAVMSDERAQPAMVVSWPPQKAARDAHIRVKLIQDHPTMAANTSWELWMLPGGKAAPVSLGLVGLEENQILKLRPEHAGMMSKAWGVALSIEPAGGSPTGAPTGPMIFKGQCVKVI
ncbi:MAG: anti-sigma factor [Pseudomonadota bacterium]